ncbi:substrate-binding domain-containing protein [Akkermansiaceae bacterium]|nr:substrate-binding domain-containing protein [Akkermansiaceae bacterium]
MANLRIFTASQQVAEHLRSEIISATWAGAMPGEDSLIARLGVGRATVQAAVRQLEGEGLLVPQGAGKRRLIVPPENQAPPAMRIAILLYDPDERKVDYLQELKQLLGEAGHTAFFAPKTLVELGMKVERVGNLVKATGADAWVVVAGSQPVLEWFAAQPLPVFGLHGRIVHVPIASTGVKRIPVLKTVVRRLVSLGHRRIVMIAREERRKPMPGFVEQAFLDELVAQGVPTGPYNLPDWEDTPAGYGRLLDSLFLHTPPTALLMDGTPITVATLQHLAERGIVVPRDVSLICGDPDPAYAFCDPVISHFSYDSRPMIRRIVRWAENIAHGKDDRRKSATLAKFVEGGTIGPAKG